MLFVSLHAANQRVKQIVIQGSKTQELARSLAVIKLRNFSCKMEGVDERMYFSC